MPKKKPAEAEPSALQPLKEPSVVRLRVEQIVPWDGNPREHNFEQVRLLQKSLDHFGIVALPVVQAGTNKLIAGHGRVQALKAAGRTLEEIPCLSVELSDEDAMAYAVTDNRLTDLSSWNIPALKAAMVELDNGAFDVELTGFTADALADMFPLDTPDDMGLKQGADPDAAPACPDAPFLKLGDLVLLGRHRLLVGDSTKSADIAVLMDGQKADMVLTDPPYNVDYKLIQGEGRPGAAQAKANGTDRIKNDAMPPEEFQDFLDAVFLQYAEATKPSAALYVFHPSLLHLQFEAAMIRAGLSVRALIIWAKTQASFGFAQYKWKHEPVMMVAKDGETPLVYLPAHETAFYAFKQKQAPFWTGDRAQTTVWTCAKEAGFKHPNQKPVELLRKPITNSSRVGMLVLDLFGGSGSTLIACESMGRRCNTMELSEVLADVIASRWQDATGKKAVVIRAGKDIPYGGK